MLSNYQIVNRLRGLKEGGCVSCKAYGGYGTSEGARKNPFIQYLRKYNTRNNYVAKSNTNDNKIIELEKKRAEMIVNRMTPDQIVKSATISEIDSEMGQKQSNAEDDDIPVAPPMDDIPEAPPMDDITLEERPPINFNVPPKAEKEIRNMVKEMTPGELEQVKIMGPTSIYINCGATSQQNSRQEMVTKHPPVKTYSMKPIGPTLEKQALEKIAEEMNEKIPPKPDQKGAIGKEKLRKPDELPFQIPSDAEIQQMNEEIADLEQKMIDEGPLVDSEGRKLFSMTEVQLSQRKKKKARIEKALKGTGFYRRRRRRKIKASKPINIPKSYKRAKR